jgi:hypothetical protein
MYMKKRLARLIGVKYTPRFAARVWVAKHGDDVPTKLPRWMKREISKTISRRVKLAEMAYRTALADYNLHPPQTVDEELYKGLRLIALHNAARSVTAEDISLLEQSLSDD